MANIGKLVFIGADMRIKQIGVTGLFGIFDHKISLNMEAHITIVYSLNGFGKTTILNMVNALFNSNYEIFRTLPFEEFYIEFDNMEILKVTKKVKSDEEENRDDDENKEIILFNKITPDSKTVSLSLSDLDKKPDHYKITESLLRMQQEFLGEVISNLLGLISKQEITKEIEKIWISPAAKNLFDFNLQIIEKIEERIQVYFLNTNRLFKSSESAVTMYSKELSNIIKQKLADFTILSQSLDKTFPARALKLDCSDIETDELFKKLASIEIKRNQLMDNGLWEKEEENPQMMEKELDQSTKAIFAVYIEDMDEKIKIFEDLYNRINLLKNIINERFRFKKIDVDKEIGFVLVDSNNVRLLPEQLSSGEQQELVLFYTMIFKIMPNNLVLIDEPELSLHVSWQNKFILDLEKILDICRFDVLIATHSPQIIHDRWDLTKELKEKQ